VLSSTWGRWWYGEDVQIGPAWDAAFAADRPCVVEAVTDPEVPPLPPHITFEQARSFLAAILKGDPNRGALIRQAWRDAVESFLPHGG
jgi:pyruvate dehydrogenase (quinone)